MVKARVKVWLYGAIGLLIWILVVWIVVHLLGLGGRESNAIRGTLLLLGVAAISALVYYFLRKITDKEGPQGAKQADDIDVALTTARNRLSAAGSADRSRLGQLPLVLCLGPTGSAKTTTIVRSGLDADLLAGEVFRGDAVMATRVVNLWYGNKTIFLEAGGRLVSEAPRFTRLAKQLQPERLGAVLSAGSQAPRSAVVCLSCEDLVKPGGGETVMTNARELRARLLEVSQKLGIRLPVYVVFTKADRIPCFTDFVRNFSHEEAREVLGVTLPWDSGPAGTYADRTAGRVAVSMQRLVASLAAHRLQFLPRETQPEIACGAYEFAREFRKLVPLATQFLVDLCKPSQLEVSPVLRGYYFSGVRAVIVNEGAQAAPVQQRQADPLRLEATQAFVPALHGPLPGAAPMGPVSRKVPQWVFLGRLFKDVLLKDRVALAATAGGAKVNLLRRVLLASAAAVAVIYILGLFVSFVGNRGLQNRVVNTARNLQGAALPPGNLPEVGTLARLDSMRVVTEQLGTWDREGAPLGLRWGLYRGSSMFPYARRIYFQRFDSLLLTSTLANLVRDLRNLPQTPSDSSPYGPSYDRLKAYLIATTFPDKSTPEFLGPQLSRVWGEVITPGEERNRVAEYQFWFYAAELPRGNPFVMEPDTSAVQHARDYLNRFRNGEQIYLLMQADAAKKGLKPFDFTKQHPEAAAVLDARHVVPAAFTRQGWAFMQDAIKNKIDQYITGEEWVVASAQFSDRDKRDLIKRIRDLYLADYMNHWRAVLAEARLTPISGTADAGRKMLALGGNTSPVLVLINQVSLNTAVDSLLSTAFQPSLTVSPADSVKVVGDKTKPYAQALVGLGTALQTLASAPAAQSEGPTQDARTQTVAAKTAAYTLRAEFNSDPSSAAVGAEVIRLLTEGLPRIEQLLGSAGVNVANKAGADLCAEVNVVLRKRPFNIGGLDATPKDLDNVFQRDKGAIANQLKGPIGLYVVEQGDGYAPRPGSGIRPNPRFFDFLSRAMQFSRAMYPAEGQPGPRFTFTFRPNFTREFSQVTLTVDGRSLTFTPTLLNERGVNWNLNEAAEARVEVTIGGNPQPLPKSGPWALFQLFGAATGWKPNGGKYEAEWTFQHEGRNVSVPFELNFINSAPILNPTWLRGLTCVSQISN
jgi:type VI secretion system protein ImpL